MKIEAMIKKIRIEIVANDYDLPGGMNQLARDTGLTPSKISKALYGHFKPVHRAKILKQILDFFKQR